MNIKTGIVIFLLISLVLYNLYSIGQNEKTDTVEIKSSSEIMLSGVVGNGLRIIPVDLDKNDINFTVYRGDYIVLIVEDGASHRLFIPSLEVDMKIPVSENETAYIKMKETGELEFTIDDTNGIINIIDFEGPQYREISSNDGAELIKNINPFILDVRTEGEYSVGHLKDAYLLPVQTLERDIGLIEKYKDQDILIYCKSGNRSTVASKILLDAGFTNVYNLRYGISGWTADGYPVIVE